MTHERVPLVRTFGTPKDKYDMVFIIGPDQDVTTVVKAVEDSGLYCCFIGNGSTDGFLHEDDLTENIRDKTDKDTKITIWAHGIAKRNAKGDYAHHTTAIADPSYSDNITYDWIDALNVLFHRNPDNDGQMMSLDVFSCQAGAVRDVPQDIKLTLHSGQKYTTLVSQNAQTIIEMIELQKYSDRMFSAYERFVLSIVCFPETAIYCEGGKRFKATAPKWPIDKDLEMYLQNTIHEFSEFLKNELHKDFGFRREEVDVLIQPEYIQRYKKMAVLMECFRGRNTNAARYIEAYLDNGVDANKEISGVNIFHDACKTGRVDIAKVYIDAGADVTKANASGENALDIALRGKKYKVVKVLVASPHCDINRPRNLAGIPKPILVKECMHGSIEMVKALLTSPHIDVNQQGTEDGHSALHVACMKGNLKLLTALLKHPDIDVSKVDTDDKTALNLALDYGHPECAKAIIDHVQKRNATSHAARLARRPIDTTSPFRS